MIAHGQVADHLGDLEDVARLDLVAVAAEPAVPVALELDVARRERAREVVEHRLADHATHADGLGAVGGNVQQQVGERDVDREVLTLLAEHHAGLTTCDDPRTVVWVHHLVANLEHARAPLPDEHRHPVRRSDSSRPSGSEAQIAVCERVLLQPPQRLAHLARPAAIEPVDVLELGQGRAQQRLERAEARDEGARRSRR